MTETPSENAIAAAELIRRMREGAAPPVVDVRKLLAFEESEMMIAGAQWRDHEKAEQWAAAFDGEVIVYCVHGHEVSQGAMAALRAQGVAARYLVGGFEGWEAAGGAMMPRTR